jgi:3-phenylpropionate/trans-cinnamate dioxygenase ferredoxin reductase subunit
MEHFVVVGAGQAASSLVGTLRTRGFDGQITLIGAEPHMPYQRPPLSKAYLLGEMDRDRLFLRNQSYYADNDITLRMGQPVVGINTTDRTLMAGTELITYDKLALTVGLEPRRLPAGIGGALEGVHVIRNLADVDALYDPIRHAKRALVVGGGYIGLEGAAVARKLGLTVTVVEMADRILNRVASPETADFVRALHQSNGVDIREGVGLKKLTGDLHVTGAELTDGSEVRADIVIAGIGMAGEVPLAAAAGLTVDHGIVVDEFCQTSDENVWAAGDCTCFPYKGGMIRLESVQNAIDQGAAAAANMMGAGASYMPYPWFWSDQYDCNLQIAGLSTGYDRIVVRGGGDAPLSHWYYQGDTFLAVDAMSDPRAYMVGKRLLEAGKTPDPDAIANPETELKGLLRA